MNNQKSEADVIKLETLYLQQKNLLERIRIHQGNLAKLSVKDAHMGIHTPVYILNEIEMEQSKLTDIQAELALVENKLQELSYASMRVDVNSKPVPTYVLINREPYYLECPFPYLGSKNETTSPGNIKMHNRYASGFETYLTILSDGGSYFEYYRHGRKVFPIIDRNSKKVIFPLGISASLSGIAIKFFNSRSSCLCNR